MPGSKRLSPSLAASLLLHGLAVGGAWTAARSSPGPAGSAEAAEGAPDVWSGSTFDVDVLAGARERPLASTQAALGREGAAEPAPAAARPEAPEPSDEPARRAADGPRLVVGLTPIPTSTQPLRDLRPPAEVAPAVPEPALPDTGGRRKRRAERLDHGRSRAAREDAVAARRGAARAERARRARDATPARRAPRAGASTSAIASSAGPATSGGAAGGADLAAGPVRGLAKALVRALPEAANSDTAWRDLPLGESRELRFTVSVDAEGKLTAITADDAPPRHVMRMLERAVLLLRGGRFALEGAEVSEGSASFRLRFRVERRSAVEAFGDPHHVQDLGHAAPEPGKPGRAWFTLRSGLHVELTIAPERAPAR